MFWVFWFPMPYQNNTLTTIAVSKAVRGRVKTVNMKPFVPVTTFIGDICSKVNRTKPPMVEAITPEISILLKLSDFLFKAPAM